MATTGYVLFTENGRFAFTAAQRTGSVMSVLFSSILE